MERISRKDRKKIVFRVVRGVTMATRRSTAEKGTVIKQIAQRKRFQRASQYASLIQWQKLNTSNWLATVICQCIRCSCSGFPGISHLVHPSP